MRCRLFVSQSSSISLPLFYCLSPAPRSQQLLKAIQALCIYPEIQRQPRSLDLLPRADVGALQLGLLPRGRWAHTAQGRGLDSRSARGAARLHTPQAFLNGVPLPQPHKLHPHSFIRTYKNKLKATPAWIGPHSFSTQAMRPYQAQRPQTLPAPIPCGFCGKWPRERTEEGWFFCDPGRPTNRDFCSIMR